MTTTEFDCTIQEMQLGARTRGALSRLGITTLGDMERAFLGDEPLHGLGPKAVEDIDRALDRLDADNARCNASAELLHEHNRLAEALMGAIDIATGNGTLNGPNVRAATANLLRDSLAKTMGALRVLAPELAEAEEVPA